jgi:WD40 repeat protein
MKSKVKTSNIVFLLGLILFNLLGLSMALAQASKPELVLQTGHTGSVNAIALTSDSRFLASGSSDNTIKIWDTTNGNVLRTLSGHLQPVLTVAINAEGSLIASGSEDASVKLWDMVTGEPRTLGSHTGPVKEVAFSVDGRQLASLSNSEVKIWDVASGREIRATRLSEEKSSGRGQVMTGMGGQVDQTATALSADGRYAAVGGGSHYSSGVLGYGGGVRSKPIKVVEVATGREIAALKLKGDMPNPTDLAFSPDGRLVVAKFTELTAKERAGKSSLIIWELSSGREVKSFQTDDQYGTGGIAFNPDGKVLATRVNRLGDANAADSASGIPDLGSGSIKLLDVASWNEIRELKNTGLEINLNLSRGFSATPLRFNSDGKMLAASLYGGIALFDTATGDRLRVLRTTEKTSAVSTTQSNQASQEEMMRQAGVDPEQLRQVREMMGSMGLGSMTGMAGALGARISGGSPISFSPDGRLLNSTGILSTSWDVVAGAPRERPRVENAAEAEALSSANQSLFSPDGKLAAAIGSDAGGSSVIITDVVTQRIARRIPIGKRITGQSQTEIPAQISGLAFGARGIVVQYCEFKMPGRGSMIFGGGGFGSDCHVKLFDPNTGQEQRDIKLDSGSGMLGFGQASSLSPDGRFIASILMDSPGGMGGGLGGLKPSLPSLGGIGIGRGKGGEMPKQKYKVLLMDLESGRKLWEIKAESESMAVTPGFIFSPRGSTLAITNYEKDQPVINLYDTMSGRKLAALSSGDKKIGTMNFSADGKLLATTHGNSVPMGRGGRPGANVGENVATIWDCSNGQQLRTLTHATPVAGVAFDPTRKLVATLGQDRNQYIWDLTSGEKLATLINLDVLNDFGTSGEWLVVTPDGLFDGSPAAWQQIMWRFSNKTFDVGPVEIFFNELYSPGLLAEIFSDRRPKAPRTLQQLDRRQPVVKLTSSQSLNGQLQSRTVTVKIEVKEAPADRENQQGSGARDLRLFRNGSLVKAWRGDILKGQREAVLEMTVPIVAGENRLTAYAFNRDNVKSPDIGLTVTGGESLKRKGTAYVLACGINQYANAQYNLKYAVADAKTFADEVKAQQAKLQQFERVEVIPLLDGEATKANILRALKKLVDASQPEDAVIIYFAGHGTAQGVRFYLVPHDLGYAGSRTALTADALKTILEHSISDLELEAAVEGLNAEQLLLVIDACNSGQALEAEEKRRGPMNSKGLAQLAYEKGMSILTAAQSYQAALETAQLGHGYLTFALIEEGLKKGTADNNRKDGKVLVREWFNYATERVPQMQEQNLGSRILLEEEKAKDPAKGRGVQRPRVFYRRELEARPLIVAQP